MGQRRTVALCVALLLVGASLLAISFVDRSGTPVPDGPTPRSPLPAPTWSILPRRHPEPVDAEESTYQAFHRALLRDDLDAAREALERLSIPEGSPSPRLAMASARLALAEGDTAAAVTSAWSAVKASPKDAQTWTLLGTALTRDGKTGESEQAYAAAQELDSSLAADMLPARWQAAVASRNEPAIVSLAEDYVALHPNSVYAAYYRAEGLLSSGAPTDAIELLVEVLAGEPTSPALLWSALARAYMARGGYSEAATALEAAAYRVARGDTSLELTSAHPLDDLNALLATAYLRTARCAEAETIYRRLSTVRDGLDVFVEAAVICQTPTPTLTPWIPQQIGTVTPRP